MSPPVKADGQSTHLRKRKLTRRFCFTSLKSLMNDRSESYMKSILCIDQSGVTLSDVDQEMRQGGDSWGAAPAEWCFYQSFTSSPYRVSDRNVKFRKPEDREVETCRDGGCDGNVGSVHSTCRHGGNARLRHFDVQVTAAHDFRPMSPRGQFYGSRSQPGQGTW